MKKISPGTQHSHGIQSRLYLLLLGFLLSVFYFEAQAQTARVAGTVSDNKGIAIPGVSVTIKGTNQGTVTDNLGSYSLEVPSKQSVLLFSNIGFLPKEEKVGDRQLISITLGEKASDLDEVVVIGYGQTQ